MPNLGSSLISAIQDGRPHNFEPDRTYLHELIIQGLEGTDGDTLKLSVRTGNLPTLSQEPISMRRGNDGIKLQGQQTVEPLSYSFAAFADPGTAKALYRWYLLHYDPQTGKQQLASFYKKQALLVQYLPDFTVSRTYLVIGLQIQSSNLGSIDMDSSDYQRIEVTFEADRAYMA